MSVKRESTKSDERYEGKLIYQSNLTRDEAGEVLAWLGRVTEKMQRISESGKPGDLIDAYGEPEELPDA